MTNSYSIDKIGNILKVGRTKEDAPGDRLLQDARKQLQALISAGTITSASVLIIDGHCSLAIGYFLAHELGHLYSVIAVCDPRLHGERQNRYVVVISYVDEYHVGDIIEYSDTKIAVVDRVTPNPPEESTFFADVEGDLLKVNIIVKTRGNQIAVDAAARIEELISSDRLKGGKLIKINGKASLLASYIIAHRLQHLYSAIAVYDPKICDVGIDRYIVTVQHGFDRPIGSVLEYPVSAKPTAKVAICGFPGAGKTCLREGLKYATDRIDSIRDDFCYVISGCPDGDTAYFPETARIYPETAKEFRQRIKKGFTKEYANTKAVEIRSVQNNLLLFDVGGRITEHNETIMSEATHAIILARHEELTYEENVQPWLKFCRRLRLPVVAIVYSDYHGTADEIMQRDDILIGKVHHLDRRADASTRPMVEELAKLLITLPEDRSNKGSAL